MDFSIYDDQYYLTGRESGRSLYTSYSWLPTLTIPFTRRIAEYCHIHEDDTICDFGCARGYVVKAFRELGFRAEGVDASQWAIDNCDQDVKAYVRQGTKVWKPFDFCIAKDVLEHIPEPDLTAVISNLLESARKGVFVVVPLSAETDGPYVVPDYEKDVTHCQRLTLGDWHRKLQRSGWCVGACYRVPGVKDNYWTPEWEKANGFLIARREGAGEE